MTGFPAAVYIIGIIHVLSTRSARFTATTCFNVFIILKQIIMLYFVAAYLMPGYAYKVAEHFLFLPLAYSYTLLYMPNSG